MREDQEKPTKVPSINEIAVDGEVAIVAGSDTTSTTISGAFYYLLTNPEQYARLRKEVDETFPPGEEEPSDGTRLAQMKFLNAVMYAHSSFTLEQLLIDELCQQRDSETTARCSYWSTACSRERLWRKMDRQPVRRRR